MPTYVYGYFRATCCYPDACITGPCYCICGFCSLGACGGGSCSSGTCTTCYAPAYDGSWPNIPGSVWCSSQISVNCGQLFDIWDYTVAAGISYAMVTEGGPLDCASSGVISELTRGAWFALGHSDMYGTDYGYVKFPFSG